MRPRIISQTGPEKGTQCSVLRRAAPSLVLLGIAGALVSALARAEDEKPTARLEFANVSSLASCPGERTFRDRVAARLGLDPFEAGAARTVVATLRDDKQKLRGEVVLRGADGNVIGRRELTAPRGECSELVESMASVVSLLLDPLGKVKAAASASATSLPTSLPPPATAEPTATATPSATTTPAPAPPPTSAAPVPEGPRLRFAVRASAYAGVGRGPAPTLGARIGGEGRYGALGLGLELAFESTLGATELETGDRASAAFVLGGIVPCYRRRYLSACLPLHGGFAQGEGPDVVSPTVRRTLAGFVGGRIGVPIPLGSLLELEPFLGLDVALVRTRFQVSQETVWTQSPVSGTLGLSLMLTP